MRVPTADGDLWFKESAPALSFEPALTRAVAAHRPDRAPEVLALEGARMLTRDAGPSLRAVLDAGGAGPPWEQILPLYAELQIELAAAAGELISLGTPDRRPAAIVEAYDDLLDHPVVRASAEQRERLRALVPEVERLAESLGDTVPHSASHEEVHEGNIHVRDGRPVLIDWGEACVSHPFTGLVNTLRGIADRFELEPGGPAVRRMRDLYLEPWTRFAPLETLREAFGSAYLLGMICRALTWDRILSPFPELVPEPYDGVSAWLAIFADAMPGPARLGE